MATKEDILNITIDRLTKGVGKSFAQIGLRSGRRFECFTIESVSSNGEVLIKNAQEYYVRFYATDLEYVAWDLHARSVREEALIEKALIEKRLVQKRAQSG